MDCIWYNIIDRCEKNHRFGTQPNFFQSTTDCPANLQSTSLLSLRAIDSIAQPQAEDPSQSVL